MNENIFTPTVFREFLSYLLTLHSTNDKSIDVIIIEKRSLLGCYAVWLL
jgi:hypothetical protein